MLTLEWNENQHDSWHQLNMLKTAAKKENSAQECRILTECFQSHQQSMFRIAKFHKQYNTDWAKQAI